MKIILDSRGQGGVRWAGNRNANGDIAGSADVAASETTYAFNGAEWLAKNRPELISAAFA